MFIQENSIPMQFESDRVNYTCLTENTFKDEFFKRRNPFKCKSKAKST